LSITITKTEATIQGRPFNKPFLTAIPPKVRFEMDYIENGLGMIQVGRSFLSYSLIPLPTTFKNGTNKKS